jgi:hypothetical protein
MDSSLPVWFQAATALAPAVGVAATVWLAYRAKHQVELAKMQIDEMREARLEATRPLLNFEVEPLPFRGSEDPEHDGAMLVLLDLVNNGKTTAKNTTFDLIPESGLNELESTKASMLYKGVPTLGPGEKALEAGVWGWAVNLNRASEDLPSDKTGRKSVVIRASWQIGDTDKESHLRVRVPFPMKEQADDE